MRYLISQAFGMVGILLNFFVYRQDSRKKLLIFKLSTDLAFMIQYWLLAAWSGTVVCLLATMRTLVFMRYRERNKTPTAWVALFVVITLLSGVLTWQGPRTLLPTACAVIAVISFSQKKPRVTRLLSLPISSSMLVYNIIVGSISGIINESLALISSASKLMAERAGEKQEQM